MSDKPTRWNNHTTEEIDGGHVHVFTTDSGVHVRVFESYDGTHSTSKMIIGGIEYPVADLSSSAKQLDRVVQTATRRLRISHVGVLLVEVTYRVDLPADYDMVAMFPWLEWSFWHEEFDPGLAIHNLIEP